MYKLPVRTPCKCGWQARRRAAAPQYREGRAPVSDPTGTPDDRPARPTSVRDIQARKGGTPLVCLTAYTAPMARLLDAHADLLLVGDSLGMAVYGMDTTLDVSVEMMINHGRAVAKSARRACVAIDLPFASYQESPEQAFRTAASVLAKTGASAIKLEGGQEMADTVRFLTQRGVPVMGHVGLTPQAVNQLGGFRIQGRDDGAAERIRADATAIARAGAFSLVVEGVVEHLAREITRAVKIPTVGIGASADCDGQVLVSEDMLGLFGERTPRFVKHYARLDQTIDDAVRQYAEEVRARSFPAAEHVSRPRQS
jgi:3-methyl-2-oxobutanoate hydroxymethyltransferase